MDIYLAILVVQHCHTAILSFREKTPVQSQEARIEMGPPEVEIISC